MPGGYPWRPPPPSTACAVPLAPRVGHRRIICDLAQPLVFIWVHIQSLPCGIQISCLLHSFTVPPVLEYVKFILSWWIP